MRSSALLALGPIVTLLVALTALSADAAHIAVDFGHENYKVALIKPGSPLDVVLNRDSKRKTTSIITVRDDTRYHASDAINLALRFPQRSYRHLKPLLGRPLDSPEVQAWITSHPAILPIADAERGTALFVEGDPATTGASYSVEELVAFMLREARSRAEETAGEPVKDAVFTIPASFTKPQRLALANAAEIAGLRVLSMMGEGSAIALYYALDHAFGPQGEYHIFYDMGAGGATATLAQFRTISVPDTTRYNKTVTQVTVLASSSLPGVGGAEWDRRVVELLADKFEAGQGAKIAPDSPVRANARAMAKLLRESIKAKEVLSANAEGQASVEGLHKDIDFRTPLKRTEIEAIVQDLSAQVTLPIQDVLSRAGVQLAELESLVHVGGGVRVPIVQAALRDYVGESKVAQNLNGDEAAVLGAAYRAATLSVKFRVRDVRVREATPYPISVTYPTTPAEGEDFAITTTTTSPLYARDALATTKKAMTFRKRSDFSLTLQYAEVPEGISPAAFGPLEYLTVDISGISKALAGYDATTGLHQDGSKLLDSRVKVTFQAVDPYGLVEVVDAQIILDLEKTVPVKAAKSTSTSASDAATSTDASSDAATTTAASSAEEIKEEATTTPEVKTKKESKSIKLTFKRSFAQGLDMPPSEKTAALTRLRLMDAEEEKVREREEAKNNLESLIYRIRDKLDEEEASSPTSFLACATPEEVLELGPRLTSIAEWLFEGEGSDPSVATKNMYRSRIDELSKFFEPASRRKEEAESLPLSIGRCDKALADAAAFFKEHDARSEAERFHDPKEVDALRTQAAELTAWFEAAKAKQALLTCRDPPVLDAEQMAGRFVGFELSLLGQTMKTKPAPPKVESKTESKTESEAESKETESEAEAKEAEAEAESTTKDDTPTHDEL